MRPDDIRCPARRRAGWTSALALPLLLAAAWPARAAEPAWPERPVRLIVPYAAGGPTDVLARIVGAKLAERWGQQVVVDLRPGANSIIGSAIAARATPDGHTLLLALPALAINQSVHRKLPYHAEKDFAPVTLVASAGYLMLVNAASPHRSVADLLAAAKAKPGAITYGSGGIASPAHLAMELLVQQSGATMEHVPFKGGAPALTELAGGQIQALVNPALSALPHVRSGRLRAIAVTGAKRSGVLPEVPTVAESGFPAYEVSTWYGVFAPSRTDARLIARMQADIAAALAHVDVRKRMAELDAEPAGSTPAEFRRFFTQELGKWRSVVEKAKVPLAD